MTIYELIRRTAAVNIADAVEESIQETKADLVQAQVEQQYLGLDVNGKKIGKYKNKAYAAKKFAMNPMAGFGNIDLHFTGELHFDIFAEVRESSVVFGSLAPHYPEVATKWPNAFGLNSVSRSEYSLTKLSPTFIKNFKAKIFK